MSFVKPEVKTTDKPSEQNLSMCQAHGCPNRWSINDEKGRLCRWHRNADPMDWPKITTQLKLGMAPTSPVPPERQAFPQDVERRKEIMQGLRATFGGGGLNKDWAYRLKAKEEAGEPINVAQKAAWRAALRYRNDEE